MLVVSGGCAPERTSLPEQSGTPVQLTRNDASDFHPSWSPDGTMILYDSEEGDSASVRVLDVDGLSSRVLAAGDHPYWLPDGRGVTAVQYLPEGIEVVSVFSLEDATARVLTNAEGRNGAGFPSPDGEQVAFLSNRDGDWEVYVVPAAGGAERRITDNEADEFFSGWAPDGSHLAYQSHRDGNWDLFMVRLEDGVETQLTRDEGDESALQWSPQGDRFVFTSSRSGNRELYMQQADGSALQQLTESSGGIGWHRWSPDGTRVAYVVSESDDRTTLHVLHVETGRDIVVVDHPSHNVAPDWAPDGQRLVFASDRDGDFDLYLVELPR
jgi:TolB protein